MGPYCECSFPTLVDAIDVDHRPRKKCDRCKKYEDPTEAAENGRPVAVVERMRGGPHEWLGDRFDRRDSGYLW